MVKMPVTSLIAGSDRSVIFLIGTKYPFIQSIIQSDSEGLVVPKGEIHLVNNRHQIVYVALMKSLFVYEKQDVKDVARFYFFRVLKV